MKRETGKNETTKIAAQFPISPFFVAFELPMQCQMSTLSICNLQGKSERTFSLLFLASARFGAFVSKRLLQLGTLTVRTTFVLTANNVPT